MSNRRQQQISAEPRTTDGVATVSLRPEASVFVPSWCKEGGEGEGSKLRSEEAKDTKKKRKNQRKRNQRQNNENRHHGRRRQSRSETSDFPTLNTGRPAVSANHRRRQRCKEVANRIEISRKIRQQAYVRDDPRRDNDAEVLSQLSFPALLPARTTAHEISATWSQTPNMAPSVGVTAREPTASVKPSTENDLNGWKKQA